MANLTQNAVVPLPADEVPGWVKNFRIETYTQTVLATMVTYDASERRIPLASDCS